MSQKTKKTEKTLIWCVRQGSGVYPSNGHRHLFLPNLHLFVYVHNFSKSSPSSNIEKSRHIVKHSYFNKYTIRLVEAYFSGSNPCKKNKTMDAEKPWAHNEKNTHRIAGHCKPGHYILNSIRIFPCCNPFFWEESLRSIDSIHGDLIFQGWWTSIYLLLRCAQHGTTLWTHSQIRGFLKQWVPLMKHDTCWYWPWLRVPNF